MTGRPAVNVCALALASREGPKPGQSWIHVLPAGTFTARDGRGPYRVESTTAIMQFSRQIAGRRAIPVDYDHQIDHATKNGRPAVAAGWITGLQARADGIWGLVEWTGRAAQHLAEREYRYLSPVFNHTPDGRVTAILRAALVNNPGLDQLTALASMEEYEPMDEGIPLAELRTALELPDTADAAAILAAVRALKTQKMAAGTPSPAEYVPIGDYLRVTQELNRVHQGVELHAAQTHVDEQIRAGRLLPFQKEWGVQLCSINKPAFDRFIAEAGGITARLLEPGGGSSAPPGRGARASDLTDGDAHVASILGHSPEQMNKAGGK